MLGIYEHLLSTSCILNILNLSSNQNCKPELISVGQMLPNLALRDAGLCLIPNKYDMNTDWRGCLQDTNITWTSDKHLDE